MVVGSGHGDTPKYTGEGVALCGTPSTLGVPLPHYSCHSMAVLGNFGWACFRCGASKVHHLETWTLSIILTISSESGPLLLSSTNRAVLRALLWNVALIFLLMKANLKVQSILPCLLDISKN